jgi:hypothetical protein
MVTPVSAFYFEFHYFETDKLVYEVGETINMVAKLIADFSGDGWCYVSFAVVTDQGPTFSSSYFISPSSNPRYFNSSYTILPEDTSPGVNGTQAFVIFNVEIYDSYSQGGGDTVIVNITRGNLGVVPMSPLNIEFNANTTLDFKVVSIHNQSIPYRNSPVTVTLFNSTSYPILQSNTATTSNGAIQINWTDTTGPPGNYTVVVAGNGTEDFLPFSESFPLTVTRAGSNLTVLSVPSSVHCQTPDGSQIDSVDILVEQTTREGQPISASIIQWETSFSSGTMNALGNGLYNVSIPFNTEPGFHNVSLTSANPLYRNESESITVDVIPYIVQLSTTNDTWSAKRGNNITLHISINSTLLQSQLIPIEITDSIGEIEANMLVAANSPSAITLSISDNTSLGLHTISIEVIGGSFIAQDPLELEIIVNGTIHVNAVFDVIYYGELAAINLNVTDDNGLSVESIDVRIFGDTIVTPFAIISNGSTSLSMEILFPLWIYPGSHILHLYINSPWCDETNISQSIVIWMRTSIIIVVGNPNPPIPLSPVQISPIDYDAEVIFSTSSSGSIINPPPIFVSGTTSTELPTTLETSLESCPRLSSGTNNRSTDLANSFISESGNGHMVLKRSELNGGAAELLAINSSTDLDVQPYDITPHSADSCPETMTSERKFLSF